MSKPEALWKEYCLISFRDRLVMQKKKENLVMQKMH